ncbi:MAG: MoaD/ThiS family protein [Dehalococcoidia bacterium]|jgi:molybdopterin converting factor small subunit|nr:MoaD/ThiS family protein [Dehalococcoidia bacterium]
MQDILAERSKSGELRREIAYEPGMVAGDVVSLEGFSGAEAEAIVVMVNSAQAQKETPLNDGDTVELVTQMVGGDGMDAR